MYNGIRFNNPDPLAGNRPWESPYAFCGNNPVNRIDPDGRDWYEAADRTRQYDPNIKSQEDLINGGTYLGVTHQEKGAHYRADGSIMFANEKDGYARIWNNSQRTGNEEFAVITNSGVLVAPNYKNTSSSVNISDYGYDIQNGNVVDASGTIFNTVATVHTHPGGGEPSTYTVRGYGDLGLAAMGTPYKPVYVLQMNEQKSVSYIVSAPYETRIGDKLDFGIGTIKGINVDGLISGAYSLRSYTQQNNFKKLLGR